MLRKKPARRRRSARLGTSAAGTFDCRAQAVGLRLASAPRKPRPANSNHAAPGSGTGSGGVSMLPAKKALLAWMNSGDDNPAT